MFKIDIYLIRYNVGENKILHKAAIKSDSYEEAEQMLLDRYSDFNIKIHIEEYELIEDDGIFLTWHEPV